MQTVTSKDGTTIAFDQTGSGPVVIPVGGALQFRALDFGLKQMAEMFAPQFTVLNYDRRGRGDSSDTQPFSVQREIEDIEALIDCAGGSAYLFGISSGAALAMEAGVALGSKRSRSWRCTKPLTTTTRLLDRHGSNTARNWMNWWHRDAAATR